LRLDIVIPAHNEEHRIDRTLTAYRAGCPSPDTQFHVALDHCTDRTAEIVRAHQRADGRVAMHEYPKLGKGGVLAETFRRSDAELVGFVDADGATPPVELLRLVDVAQRADGAIASRHHPASVLPATRTLTRRLTSAGFAFGVRRLLGLPYRDTQCGAKVLRGDVARDVVSHTTACDLMFDVDLLVTARRLGARVVEVPTVWIDQDGSRVDPIADSRRMGASLLRLWAASIRRRLRTAGAGAGARASRAGREGARAA
jgi:glycosyltransferase involved in cell wall biosynthesis